MSHIPPARFSDALIEVAIDHGGVPQLLAILELNDSPAYRPLKALWARTKEDEGNFHKGVEDWFTGEMQRVSALYRHHIRKVLFIVALLVTMFFAVDSLEYVQDIVGDNAIRTEIAAEEAVAIPALGVLVATKCPKGVNRAECLSDVLRSPAIVKLFSHSPINMKFESGEPAMSWGGGLWLSRLFTLAHLPGYLITLLALMFGTSFWWNMLLPIIGFGERREKPAS